MGLFACAHSEVAKPASFYKIVSLIDEYGTNKGISSIDFNQIRSNQIEFDGSKQGGGGRIRC